jgi:hypothetical protein
MENNFAILSLNDLGFLKRELLSQESLAVMTGDKERATELRRRWTMVEAEIKERIENVFNNKQSFQ